MRGDSPECGAGRAANPLALAWFWLGIQAVWGAVLAISLQARSIELAPRDAIVAYGHLATLGAAVAACVQIGAGVWSDRRRRRGSRRLEFYAAGAVGAAAAIAWFYGAPTFAQLVAAFVLLQVGMNVASGPYQAIIPDFAHVVSTGRASSWMAALQGFGNAIGAVCAAALKDGRAIAAALIVLLLGTAAATCAHVRAFALPAIDAKWPRPTRTFADLFVSRAFVYVGFYTLLGYLLFYVRAMHGNAALSNARLASGALVLVFTASSALGAVLAARPAERVDARLLANVGGTMVIAGLGAFIASHAFAWSAAAAAIAGFGWGAFLVADWVLACRLLPGGSVAAAMGLWNLALLLAQIVAPALTTFVLLHAGAASAAAQPRTAFALAAGETLLGIAWLWRLPGCTIRE